MARIRVAHVLYSFGTGGLEKGISTLVRHASADLEHVVVCLDASGASAALLPAGTQVLELHKPPGNSLRFLWKLAQSLRAVGPDVVHTRNWGGHDAILAARVAGLRGIVHGEHGWGMEDPEGLKLRRVRVRRFLARWVREYTCVSRAIERWLCETVRVRRPVCQIYNGIDTDVYLPAADPLEERASLGLGETPFLAGVVGRLDAIKDHSTLFRAFEAVRRKLPGARLLVVGDGPERRRLEREAGEGVEFLGNRRDVPRILRALDVFVLPSLNEGISNTILEAMATGLPVVASRVGGNPELVEDGVTGCLFPAGDAAVLTEALLSLAGRPDLGRRYGRSGRERAVREFGICSMVAAYEEVYRRAARPREA